MASYLIFLSAGLFLSSGRAVAARTEIRPRSAQVLSPALIMSAFPLLTGGFIATGVDPATVVSLLIGAAVTAWRIQRTQVMRTEEKQVSTLADFLGLCISTLRAGAPMTEAMEHALSGTPTTSGVTGTLQTAARRARSGGSGQAVLIDAPLSELHHLGTLWEASEKHGIPLVRLLEQMRRRIDSRRRHRQATAAQLQGPQATAVILALLPLAGILMGTVMGADPLGFLTGGGLGGLLLVTGVILVAGGFVMTQKILEGANPS